MTNIADQFCGQSQPHAAHQWTAQAKPMHIMLNPMRQCAGLTDGMFLKPPPPEPAKCEHLIAGNPCLRTHVITGPELTMQDETAVFKHDDGLVCHFVDGVWEVVGHRG